MEMDIQNMSASELSSYLGEIVRRNLMTKQEIVTGLKYALESFQKAMKE